MSYAKEIDAFRAFTKTFPDKSTLLVDTYDDISGAEKAAVIAKELEAKGYRLGGVRLDSGDLTKDSKKIRKFLDSQGLGYVKIFASGDLDEFKIEELLKDGARIDSFGVGTKMGTSADRPYLDVIYKLCETMKPDGTFSPIMKLSKDKITLPGRKQVYRFFDGEGNYEKDRIALADEKVEAEPLLVKMMEKGKLTYALPPLEQIRADAAMNLSKLPEEYKASRGASVYPVELSRNLLNSVKTLKRQLTKNEINHVGS